jgi:hypothetical protein
MHSNHHTSIPNIEIGQKVRFSNLQTGRQCIAEVTSKAGKATGKNKNWYNMKYLEPEDMKGDSFSQSTLMHSNHHTSMSNKNDNSILSYDSPWTFSLFTIWTFVINSYHQGKY